MRKEKIYKLKKGKISFPEFMKNLLLFFLKKKSEKRKKKSRLPNLVQAKYYFGCLLYSNNIWRC